jgi:hypothetical protein
MGTTDRSVEVDSDKFWAAVLDYGESGLTPTPLAR